MLGSTIIILKRAKPDSNDIGPYNKPSKLLRVP